MLTIKVIFKYLVIISILGTVGGLLTAFDHSTMVNQYIPWYESSLHAIYPNMTDGDLTGLAYGGLMYDPAFTTSTEYAMKGLYQSVNSSYKDARSGVPCH